MPNKNICKFSIPLLSDTLYTTSFIYETSEQAMKQPYITRENRAYLISGGEGCLCVNRDLIEFKTGDLIFAFKGEKVAVAQSRNCEYIYIDFGGTRATELFRRFGIIDGNRKFSGYDGLIPFWHESLLRASQENIDLSAESVLLYAFSRLSVNEPAGNPVVNEIIRISEEKFRDMDFNIGEIARTIGYNPKYLSHVFKEKTGVPYSEYLRDLRIKYAVKLFDHGLESVKNTAVLSGFSDPLYFSTVFKKCIGVTPRDYIRGKEK